MTQQTWLIVEVGTPAEVSLSLCESLGCNGFYSGIPPFLREIAQAERWTLPHLWDETINDQSSGNPDLAGWSITHCSTSTEGQRFFAVTGLNLPFGRHAVYKNGLLMLLGAQNDYTVDASGVTFTYELQPTDTIVILS